MAFCTKCGAKIPDGAKFCNSCGEKLGSSSTSTEEKIVAFVENFDVNEKISKIKKTAESSEEIAQIKGKISEVKEAVESNEKVAEIKENLKSNEKVAAFLEKVSWKKILVAAVIIFAALKIFGSDETLGITPEEFKDRYNRNLQVMFKEKSTLVEITDIQTEKLDNGELSIRFINRRGIPLMAFTGEGGNKNIENVSVMRSVNEYDRDGNEVLTLVSIAAYSAVHSGVASKNDITETREMFQKLVNDGLKNASLDAADSKIVKDGIQYGFVAVNGRRDALVVFSVQTEKSVLRNKQRNAEGR